jgi:hypothetical protein
MANDFDVIIIGAGAAGLMCSIEAGKRGRRVWLIDHSEKTAEKIRIAGGGRCNFTNLYTSPANFLSQNPHFCKSALQQYTQEDFIALVRKHRIAFHEKKLGQLFCDDSAQQIIDMLLHEVRAASVNFEKQTHITSVEKSVDGFRVQSSRGTKTCTKLVIATGGLSIPKIGATSFGYDIARQFGHNIIETRPALVPLTFTDQLKSYCAALSGLSLEAVVRHKNTHFAEGFLFTHRGLSGPSILQISSYWREGEDIQINLAPHIEMFAFLKKQRAEQPRQDLITALSLHLPKRLAASICDLHGISGHIAELSDKKLETLAIAVNAWRVTPNGTEGYRTAEVTRGGVDTKELSSKTMESNKCPHLYFIGEVIDVTGHLGGFNFQWAWSSGFAAGHAL